MYIIGIDVDKVNLTCSLRINSSQYHQRIVPNDHAGLTALLKWAQRKASADINALYFVMEATSIYHQLAAETLYHAGAQVSVVNPLQAKRFGQSQGRRSKTDPIDAQMLADYAQANTLSYFEPEPSCIKALKQLITRLEAIEKDLQRERNREHKATIEQATQFVLASLTASIEHLQKQAQALREQIDDHIDKHPDLKHDKQLLLSIDGVGKATAPKLLALMRTHQFNSVKALVGFVGIDPRQQESGAFKAKSSISKMGAATVRSALYFPTIVATQHNPIVKAHYQQLLARGKAKMSALIAAMRKLLHIVYGVLKNQMPFNSRGHLIS